MTVRTEYIEWIFYYQPRVLENLRWVHFTRRGSLLDRSEVKMDLMLFNMKNNIFSLISAIIIPNEFTLCYR